LRRPHHATIEAQLSRSAASARQATGWGLGDADVNIGFIGVPSLQSNWK
jgi:hypothetical protein